ncbi:MAG: RNA methyltransferase, partial [Phycisphaerales bacterium]
DPLALADRSRALIVLEDLSNHDNVGSVFRSAAALGGAGVGVLLSRRCCDPLYRKALRVSMGHALSVPFAMADDLPALMGDLEAMGYTTIALTPDPGSMTLDDSLEPGIQKPALCLGAEGPGLSDALLAAARQRVKIPMAEGVDSLNIAVAAAICMHRYLTPT